MKKLFTFLVVIILLVPGLFAQSPDAGDAVFVKNWTAPVPSWWAKLPATKQIKKQATTSLVADFNATEANFDSVWASIPGNGNILGADGSTLGLVASDNGPADFKGSFKVVADEYSIYILLQYTDDDVTGNETVEVAWAPYDSINAPVLATLPQAWYARYQQFGAYKATFKKTGFDAAMMVDGSTGAVNWGGTNDVLSQNLFVDNHTAIGSNTVKQIITIGYSALTGEARPDFDQSVWKMLNSGKGISLDMKVNDKDKNDAFKADGVTTAPAEYWWNTIHNDSYALTAYAGYLSAPSSVPGAGDAVYVKDWTAPIPGWWAKLPATKQIKKQARAAKVADFDAAGSNFDAVWAKITGEENILGDAGSRLGLVASDKGPADFTGSFKAVFDEYNIYILLKYTDDDVTGNETVEVAWAPYDSINAPVLTALPQAWYARYQQFGAYKATFKKTGFDAAMMVNGSNGNVNWGGTNEILSNNLYFNNHTAIGSNTVKQIITIGFSALTGEARPDFDPEIWEVINGGKGISLDMKVNDKDGNDAFKADGVTTAPAEYWWNAIHNDSYALTAYAGYLDNKGAITSIKVTKIEESIFGGISNYQIHLTKSANVTIYNTLGQPMKSLRNVNLVDISDLRSGIYIIRADNETKKFFK